MPGTADERPHPRGLRDRGEFARSGDRFTETAYRILSNGAISDANHTQIGGGLHALLHAAITYRIGDEDRRCRNRCRQGVSIAEDLVEAVITEDAARGILREYIGDFRVIGDLEGAEDAYRTAIETYGRNDMVRVDGWPADGLVHDFLEFFLELFEVAGRDVPDGPSRYGFVERVEYKIGAYPDLVAEVSAVEEWPK